MKNFHNVFDEKKLINAGYPQHVAQSILEYTSEYIRTLDLVIVCLEENAPNYIISLVKHMHRKSRIYFNFIISGKGSKSPFPDNIDSEVAYKLVTELISNYYFDT